MVREIHKTPEHQRQNAEVGGITASDNASENATQSENADEIEEHTENASGNDGKEEIQSKTARSKAVETAKQSDVASKKLSEKDKDVATQSEVFSCVAIENKKNSKKKSEIEKQSKKASETTKQNENKSAKSKISKKIAYSGILAATLIAGKYVLSFLPNVEIVSPLIILSAVFFGIGVSLPSAVVFVIVDTIIYGFYPTVLIQYAFHFPLLAITSYFAAKKGENLLKIIIISFIFSMFFWVETPIINVIFKFSLFLPTLISGIPFMVAQSLSSIAFCLVLYKPFKEKLAPQMEK